MRRFANWCAGALLMLTSSVASATSCLGFDVEELVRFADRIVLVKVTSVSPKSRSNQMGPSATVETLKTLKGHGAIEAVDTSWLGGVRLVSGETRVLFTDRSGVIIPCSEYRPELTDAAAIVEIERALKKRAT